MASPQPRPRRRTVLTSAAGVAIAAALPGPARSAQAAAARPGEFDFLSGEWRIRHRRQRSAADWDEFEGEATCWSILGGVASVEELRIPARDFSGMGLRTLDAANGVWIDYWMNAKSGVMGAAGTPGRFTDGAGVFESDDMDGERPIKVRGVWDEITSTSCRWRQGMSADAGATWDWNWIMYWTRV